jgi:hypothetical protein
MALTADQILAADDAALLEVKVKEWGGSVFIRVMSVAERDAYERMWIGKRDTGIDNFRTEYLQRVLCDEKGSLLFTREQIEKLGQKSSAVMSRLFEKATKHNAMSEADVEELAKN